MSTLALPSSQQGLSVPVAVERAADQLLETELKVNQLLEAGCVDQIRLNELLSSLSVPPSGKLVKTEAPVEEASAPSDSVNSSTQVEVSSVCPSPASLLCSLPLSRLLQALYNMIYLLQACHARCLQALSSISCKLCAISSISCKLCQLSPASSDIYLLQALTSISCKL